MALTYHSHVMLDGEIREDGASRGWPSAASLIEMDGFFETIKIIGTRPAFFREHCARLRASCIEHGFRWLTRDDELREHCDRLLRANRCSEGSMRVVVVNGAKGCQELIFSRDPSYPAQTYVRGFRLKTVLDGGDRPKGPAHKSTRYVKNISAREAAHAAGFDEALFVSDQEQVLEGAVSNVFAILGGRVITPPLAHGILPGVARGQIMQRWSGVEEQTLTEETLREAEEVFVTNALLGVMPVSAVDGRVYSIEQYQVTRRLMDAFYSWQEQSL